MKRVVMITNIPAPYRVDFFYFLQQHFKEYELHVLYASRNEDNRSWEIEDNKMKNSHFLESYTIKIPRRYDTKYIHISKGVKSVLEKLKPDAVIGSEYNPTVLQALQYCRCKKIPYISWTDGTLHSERNINSIQRMLRKYVIRHASSFLASSTKSREAQIAYGAKPEDCFVSLLTVDIEKYLIQPEERTDNRILYVGSLIERKGVDLLLKALQQVEGEFTLALAGTGAEQERLQQLAKELKIEENVEFLGYLSQDKLKKEYARSSIFVLPTREDCFALVILEAMCAGLPVICSQYADGAYDLIKEGKNGFIADPYDTKKFAARIQELLAEPVKAKRMGDCSRNYLDRFRFEEVSRGVKDALERAAQKI